MAKTDGYSPDSAPAQNDPSVRALAQWTEKELTKISQTLQGISLLTLQVLYVEPTKPRDGQIVYADGTHWNPGSGAGPYARIAGVWTKLFP